MLMSKPSAERYKHKDRRQSDPLPLIQGLKADQRKTRLQTEHLLTQTAFAACLPEEERRIAESLFKASILSCHCDSRYEENCEKSIKKKLGRTAELFLIVFLCIGFLFW